MHVRAGAVLELTALSVSPAWHTSTITEAAALLQRFGGEHVVLSSDAGQAESPPPPEALRAFAQSLHEAGVPEGELRKALVATPTRLLDR